MLTATYSLVALSTEQQKARHILRKLQHQIHQILHDLQNINHGCIESALSKLEQFEEYCHKRKVEIYVIPAIRQVTHEADPILEELDSLSARSLCILRSMKEQLRAAVDQGQSGIRKLCSAMEMYCLNLWKRLVKEEEELLPIVRKSLPIEVWFDIAAKFLSDEENRKYTKPALLTS